MVDSSSVVTAFVVVAAVFCVAAAIAASLPPAVLIKQSWVVVSCSSNRSVGEYTLWYPLAYMDININMFMPSVAVVVAAEFGVLHMLILQ